MGRAKTDSFILELPLRVSPTQEKQLLARLEAARQVYNGCLGESLKRLALLRQSKVYQAARKLPKGSKKARTRTLAFREANGSVGFREYDLHAYAVQFNHCWIGDHLDIHVIQKLATRAFRAVQQHSFGKRGRPLSWPNNTSVRQSTVTDVGFLGSDRAGAATGQALPSAE